MMGISQEESLVYKDTIPDPVMEQVWGLERVVIYHQNQSGRKVVSVPRWFTEAHGLVEIDGRY